MRNLILLSKYFPKEANEFVCKVKNTSELEIAFCDTPADNSSDKQYVINARNEIESYGHKLTNYSLHDFQDQPNKYNTFLKQFDANYFSGGNAIYLNYLLNKYNLRNQYREDILNGLIHIGQSAGALVTSKLMKYYRVIDADSKNIPDDYDELGLDLFSHYISPHYSNKEKYTKRFEEVIKKFPKTKDQIIPLTNSQFITVKGDTWEIH